MSWHTQICSSFFRSNGNQSFVSDALRDLLVVVVGILAALWIEAWWQDMQNRREERLILEGLQSEFLANRDQLLEISAIIERSADAAYGLHLLTFDPPADPMTGQVDKLLSNFFDKKRFDPRMGQLKSIINSGKLVLISNRNLRALIADWPDVVADLEDNEQMLWDHSVNRLFPYMSNVSSGWDESAFHFDDAAMFKSAEFDNLLSQDQLYAVAFVEEGDEVLAVTNRIIELINAELAQ